MLSISLPNIKTFNGKNSGSTVAIFGGSHGDEPAGPDAIHILADLVTGVGLDSGTVHFVITNPTAIERGIRSINVNLNRRFFSDNFDQYPEDENARILMELLNTCDALIDLHEHKDQSVGSLALCEIPSVQMAMQLPVEYVITGMDTVEADCTDTFMFHRGKIGICHEAGHISDRNGNIKRHLHATVTFLQNMGIIIPHTEELYNLSNFQSGQPMLIRTTRGLCRQSSSFAFAPNIFPMKPMAEGQIIAEDGCQSYLAKEGEVVIFPRPNVPIGNNACLIGIIDRLRLS